MLISIHSIKGSIMSVLKIENVKGAFIMAGTGIIANIVSSIISLLTFYLIIDYLNTLIRSSTG